MGKSWKAKCLPYISVSYFTWGSTRNTIRFVGVCDSASAWSERQHPIPCFHGIKSRPRAVVVFLVIIHMEEPGILCGQNIKFGVLHHSWLFAMQMGGFVSHSTISMVTKWRQVCITSLVKCNPSPGTCANEAYTVKGTAIYFLEREATKINCGFFFNLFNLFIYFPLLFRWLLFLLLYPPFPILSFSRVPVKN